MSDWCILRTSPRATLRLAETLATDGFEVWTPVETRTIVVPRMNAKRRVRLPIMPGYVFARSPHLVDLLMLAAMPVKPRRGAGLREPAHDDFRVLKCCGKLAFVRDDNLGALRDLQAKLTPKPPPPPKPNPKRKADYTFKPGAAVRIIGGSFGGLDGTVEESDRGLTVVCFGDRFTVKIATRLLSEDEVSAEESTAALIAA